MKKHGRSLMKVYLLLTSLAGLIGMLIGYGILLYAIGHKLVISNEEYIASDRQREITQCEENLKIDEVPTKEEVADCKQEATARVVVTRHAQFKEDLLGGLIRGTLFLVVFLIHYPRFRKEEK